MKKKSIDWEEIDVKDLIANVGQEDPIEYNNMFEMVLEKYIERVPIIRVLHTNFSLGLPLLKKLSMVEGVETLLPIGRYRAVIMFGKLFEPQDIKKEILLQINKFLYNKELRKMDEENVT